MYKKGFAITFVNLSSFVPVTLVLFAGSTSMFWNVSSMFDSLISIVSLQSAESLAEFSLGLASIKCFKMYGLGIGIIGLGYSNLFLSLRFGENLNLTQTGITGFHIL